GLHILEHAAGPYQPITLIALGEIARTYAAAGDLPNAIARRRQTEALIEKQTVLHLAVGSERQKLAFARSLWEETDGTISLDLRLAPSDADAGALAALVVLQRKGRVLDSMTDTLVATRQRVATARDRELLDRLNITTAELARVALNTPDAVSAEDRQTA